MPRRIKGNRAVLPGCYRQASDQRVAQINTDGKECHQQHNENNEREPTT